MNAKKIALATLFAALSFGALSAQAQDSVPAIREDAAWAHNNMACSKVSRIDSLPQ